MPNKNKHIDNLQNYPNDNIELGKVLLKEKKYCEAEKLFTKVVKHYPQS